MAKVAGALPPTWPWCPSRVIWENLVKTKGLLYVKTRVCQNLGLLAFIIYNMNKQILYCIV